MKKLLVSALVAGLVVPTPAALANPGTPLSVASTTEVVAPHIKAEADKAKVDATVNNLVVRDAAQNAVAVQEADVARAQKAYDAKVKEVQDWNNLVAETQAGIDKGTEALKQLQETSVYDIDGKLLTDNEREYKANQIKAAITALGVDKARLEAAKNHLAKLESELAKSKEQLAIFQDELKQAQAAVDGAKTPEDKKKAEEQLKNAKDKVQQAQNNVNNAKGNVNNSKKVTAVAKAKASAKTGAKKLPKTSAVK